MSANSSIEWTDATWNPVRGCVKVSPGCKHCYAETFAERFRGVAGHPYEQGFDVRLVPQKLDEPLHWRKPRRVFVNSMSDLFQDGVPDDYLDRVFAVMALAPHQKCGHTFQVLTKRAARMCSYANDSDTPRRVAVAMIRRLRKRIPAHLIPRWPLPNVWLGVSCENQETASERVPLLLQTPAAVRFVSAEPLLAPINFCDVTHDGLGRDALRVDDDSFVPRERFLDWIIVGGESGPGARPCDVAWVRSIVEQCRGAGADCFVKQLGAHAHDGALHLSRAWTFDCGAREFALRIAIRDRKGADPGEWDADLRVREIPDTDKTSRAVARMRAGVAK